MRKIIMLSGKQGSGKSSIAKGLEKILLQNGLVPKIFKFADPLYDLHNACLPVLWRHGVRPKEMTKDGELLQVLGTEYGRLRVHPDVWVMATMRAIGEFLSDEANQTIAKRIALIDDCRFENEFDAFEAQAFCVRLQAPRTVRKRRASYWRKDEGHPSETSLDTYDAAGKFHLYVDTNGAPAPENILRVKAAWEHFA